MVDPTTDQSPTEGEAHPDCTHSISRTDWRGLVDAGLKLLLAGSLDHAGTMLGLARDAAATSPAWEEELLPLHDALGQVDAARGRYDEALAHHCRALAVATAHRGEEHEEVGRQRIRLGAVMARLRRFDDATAEFGRALALTSARCGPGSIELGRDTNECGYLLLEAGVPALAETHLSKALELYEFHFGVHHLEVAKVLFNLARCRIAGNRGCPRDLLDRCRDILDRQAPDPGSIELTIELALFYRDILDLSEALDLLVRAAARAAAVSWPDRGPAARIERLIAGLEADRDGEP